MNYLAHSQRTFFGVHFGLYYLIVFKFVESLETFAPSFTVALFKQSRYGRNSFLAISKDGNVDFHVLVYFRRVDVEMYFLCAASVSFQVPGYPVVETHTYRYEQVAFLSLNIGSITSVHAKHTYVQRMVGRQGRKPEQCTTCRCVGFLYELYRLLLRVAEFHSLPHKNERLLCFIYKFCCFYYRFLIRRRHRLVAAYIIYIARLVLCHFGLRVFRKIQYNRPWASAPCNIESPAYCPGYLFGTTYLIGPF